jgi:methylglutaconyl-CoA hydratase
MTSFVSTEIDDGIAVVTLNRADKHNAFDDGLIADLTATFRAVDVDPDVRVVVLSAAGKSFSAGADLNWMKRMAGYSEEENFRDASALAALMRTLHGLSKPTIARVQGAAYGGGVGLIACCDMAVGSHEAAFALSEVRIGLIPAAISPYVIAAIGERAAHRYFLTGERFDAAEGYRLGLLSDLQPTEDAMDDKIEELVSAVLVSSPAAIHEAKQLIAAVANRPIDDRLATDTAQRIARVRVSADGREGVSAFLEKRRPNWIAP